MIQLLLKLLRRLPKPVRKTLFHVVSLTSRAMTLGVRIFVQDADGRVLLVKHTYLEGWHLPGGGVERGETIFQAAEKELFEETGFKPTAPMKLFYFYKNPDHSKFDHVALLTADLTPNAVEFFPNSEISEIGFYSPESLPEDATQATRKRISEVISGVPTTKIW